MSSSFTPLHTPTLPAMENITNGSKRQEKTHEFEGYLGKSTKKNLITLY